MYLALIFPILFVSCNIGLAQENKVKVGIWCLRNGIDRIIFKIENQGTVPIYIPEDFWIQYLEGQDTLYFESISKKKYGEKSSYYYNQFGETYISREVISGLKPDSIINESVSYETNQFVAPKLIELKPNKYIIKKQRLIFPLSLEKAVFTLYNSNFSLKDYTKSDFIEFEKKSSFLFFSKIYEVLNP
jgi:hypothetical protein